MGQMLRSEVASRRFKTGLQLGVLHANVALAERVARAAGLTLPLMTQTEAMLAQAEDRLGYSNDHSARDQMAGDAYCVQADGEAQRVCRNANGPGLEGRARSFWKIRTSACDQHCLAPRPWLPRR